MRAGSRQRAGWRGAHASEQIGVARRRAVGVDDRGAAGGGVLLQAREQAASGQAHPAGQAAGRLHVLAARASSELQQLLKQPPGDTTARGRVYSHQRCDGSKPAESAACARERAKVQIDR